MAVFMGMQPLRKNLFSRRKIQFVIFLPNIFLSHNKSHADDDFFSTHKN